MRIRIARIITAFLAFFLRATAPMQDTATLKAIVRWYRHTGIAIVQRFIPLFGNSVMVSLTSRCQCSCRHCGVETGKSYGDTELDEHETRQVIDEIQRLGAYAVYFFGGEPLLAPALPRFIAYARSKGLKTRLDTNGLLLDREMVLRLKAAGLDEIGISIDSPQANVHDRNRGVAGAHQKALDGILLCTMHGLACCISTVVTGHSLRSGDFRTLVSMATGMGTKLRVLSPVQCGRWKTNNDVALTPDDIGLLRTHLARGAVFWDSELVDTKEAPFLCGAAARRTLYISTAGDVQACCYVPLIFGNIRKDPLAQIVDRMRRSDFFTETRHFPDCPTNSEFFKSKYGQTLYA